MGTLHTLQIEKCWSAWNEISTKRHQKIKLRPNLSLKLHYLKFLANHKIILWNVFDCFGWRYKKMHIRNEVKMVSSIHLQPNLQKKCWHCMFWQTRAGPYDLKSTSPLIEHFISIMINKRFFCCCFSLTVHMVQMKECGSYLVNLNWIEGNTYRWTVYGYLLNISISLLLLLY